jgi:hypothetical protein
MESETFGENLKKHSPMALTFADSVTFILRTKKQGPGITIIAPFANFVAMILFIKS